MAMHSDFHSLHYDPYSKKPNIFTCSQFYERYASVLNYLLVSVVWCIYLIVLEVIEKEMVVDVQIVPFVDVHQWLDLPIGDVFILVSKYFCDELCLCRCAL